MVNEAVIVLLGEGAGTPIRRTVSESTNISKGTLCKLADLNTVSAATGTGEAFGGIATSDKVAGDGSTTLSCYMSGIFDLTSPAVATITAGAAVVISGANLIRAAVEADFPTGAVLGYAEETSSASEVIRVRLRG